MSTDTIAPPASAIDRAALRQRLVDARAGIKRLVESIPADAWGRPTANKAWSCGQLASHLCDESGLMTLIERGRNGKGLNIPMFLVNIVNVLRTRRTAGKFTRETLLAAFDAETARLLTQFEATTDAELAISVKVFGERTTVAELFDRVPGHLAEHGPEIEQAIASA